jgi:hypothetical protein
MEKLEKLWEESIFALWEAEGSLFVYQLSICKVQRSNIILDLVIR